LSELAQDLKEKTEHPSPVQCVMIPRADGSLRSLGIATIRDRVAQMAVKLVIEPIFEADFCSNSYRFRPKKSAHDAVDAIAEALYCGYPHVCPAPKSLAKIKERIRQQTDRRLTPVPLGDVVKNMNASLRGWVGYFHYRNSSQVLGKVKTQALNYRQVWCMGFHEHERIRRPSAGVPVDCRGPERHP